jgi:cytochrome c553
MYGDLGKEMKMNLSKIFILALLPISTLSMAVEYKETPVITENVLTAEKEKSIIAAYAMPTGKMLADNCSACHGTLGAEFNEAMPPLAGMKPENFIQLMKAYRAEEFPSIVMNDIAYVFTDDEIQAMADYFAAQEAVEWTQPDLQGEH